MTTTLSKADVRDLHGLVTAHQPPGRTITLEEIVRAGELAEKLAIVVQEMRPVEERGACVLVWRLPKEWALTQNEMAGLRHRRHMLKTIGTKLADDLRRLLPAWPSASLNCARKRRWIEVRRFSPRRPDDRKSADSIGAKQAIDMLTTVGVIVDDNEDWIIRDADWLKCKPGDTHVVLRVFDVAQNAVHTPALECLPPPKPVRKVGLLKKAILGGAG